MAIPSGLSSQLGVAVETTYGTFATPTKFIPFNTESLALTIERIESAGLGRSTSVLHSDNWVAGKQDAGGTVEMDVLTKGFNIIFEQMLGASVMSAPGGSTVTYDHAHTIGDLKGRSATWQVGRPDTGGTVRPFSYRGCKVTEWELSNSIDEFLKLTVTLNAKDETLNSALAASSYASAAVPLAFTGATITIGGASYTITNITVKGMTGLETERYSMGSATKTEPMQENLQEITVEFDIDFESLTAYNLFVNGTTAEIVARWQAPTAIEGVFYPFVRVTLPVCRFDGDGPQVGGPGRLTQTLKAKVLYDGTNAPITILNRTTDSDTYASASPSVSPSLSASRSPSASTSLSPSLSPSVSASRSVSLSPSPS